MLIKLKKMLAQRSLPSLKAWINTDGKNLKQTIIVASMLILAPAAYGMNATSKGFNFKPVAKSKGSEAVMADLGFKPASEAQRQALYKNHKLPTALQLREQAARQETKAGDKQ